MLSWEHPHWVTKIGRRAVEAMWGDEARAGHAGNVASAEAHAKVEFGAEAPRGGPILEIGLPPFAFI